MPKILRTNICPSIAERSQEKFFAKTKNLHTLGESENINDPEEDSSFIPS